MILHKTILKIAPAAISIFLIGQTEAQVPQRDESMQQVVRGMALAFAANQEKLHSYQWLETTSVTVDGHSATPKQSLCKYTLDGSIQKNPLGPQNPAPSPAAGGGGLLRGGLIRKAIANDKRSKYKQEGEEVRSLMSLYVPFNRSKIMEAASSGKIHLEESSDSQQAIVISSYAKDGDQIRVSLDRTTGQISKISVTTYLSKPSEKVDGTIQFARMSNGIVYPSNTSISAATKSLNVRVVNTNYSTPAQ